MKKVFLIILLFCAFVGAKAAPSCFVGCLHGRYFVAKYDSDGILTDYGFGLGCKENWCIQVYMLANSAALPNGLEFDHETENRLNGVSVQAYLHDVNSDDANQIKESVQTKTGYTYVSAEALDPEIRKFLFNY